MSTPAPTVQPSHREVGRLGAVPTLLEQVEVAARRWLQPMVPLDGGPDRTDRLDGAPVALVMAWGEGRTHLAVRWLDHGLCGAPLTASGVRGAAVTCPWCASRLPPEAE